MRVRVLGCSGGIGGGRQSTSFLVDDDILVDAGTGVTLLTLEEMSRVEHLFLTHAHLDHILALPLLLDSVGLRDRPLMVHAIPEVIEALRLHIFNWVIWPDFSRVPSPEHPFCRYTGVPEGIPCRFGEREITAIPANHGRPAVGYLIRGPQGSLLFSGDTTSHPDLVRIANETADLRHLVVECSFPDEQRRIAELSHHYCPAMLLPDLGQLRPAVQVWITHLKPGGEEEIMAELGRPELPCGVPHALMGNQEFDL